MSKTIQRWDLRSKVDDKQEVHLLLGVVFRTDRYGTYFCSCGFAGSASAISFESLEPRLIANHADHKATRLAWVEKRKLLAEQNMGR